jgi:murein DD-endopeptidase MepM/ murein hydrolase activator NlpD
LRHLQVGQVFTLSLRHDADGTTLEKLVFSPDHRQRITVSQNDDDDYAAEIEARNTEVRTVALHGRIEGSLAVSAKRAGAPRSIVNQMTHWLAYDVDFQRDIHAGDQFSVLFTAEYDDQGEMIHADAPQYISLDTTKNKVRLFEFGKRMYHADGHNVVRALLKTPVDGARVTSGFGMRFHPILGYSAMHKGIDFGAPIGAPVLAAGDGVIERANWFSSYGNYVLLKHNSTYETAYGHLSRFARGIHPGVRVHQGQVIAYVGETGRATGPHLHFEVHKGGIQVNPTKVASLGSDKLEGAELKKFLASAQQEQANYASALQPKKIRVAQNGPIIPAGR